MVHALSVDVEDWYHDCPHEAPGAPESRVERHMDILLELLAAHGARATFFFLGEVAERFPAMVRRTQALGHEIGSHGYSHRRVSDLTRREFRADVLRSMRVIADSCGERPIGYRAPYFSIKAGVRWPIDVLADLGVRYDASVLAIDRPPGLELVCPRRPFRHPNGLWEVPVAVMQMLHFWHLPLASGSGLRILPQRLFDRCLRQFERDVGVGVFYLHPWELDPGARTGPQAGRVFLRIGRRRLADRLAALMRRVRFKPIIEVFHSELVAAPGESGGAVHVG